MIKCYVILKCVVLCVVLCAPTFKFYYMTKSYFNYYKLFFKNFNPSVPTLLLDA